MADKPEVNQSYLNCTLFQPFFEVSNGNSVIRLRHVNTGNYVRRYNGIADSDSYRGCSTLLPKLQPDDNTDGFTFIDWESVVILPDLIRIKGDNENHLKACPYGFMNLSSKAENSSFFEYEVSPSRNGGIRLKSVQFGTYWTCVDPGYWVWLKKASTADHDTNTVFLPTILDGNRIMLRSLKNGLLCKRYTDAGRQNCLATLYNYPDVCSYMEIEEAFTSRKIENVKYHLTDARLYNEKTLALITDDSSNRTKHPQTSQVNLKTTVSNTTSWSISGSLELGVKFTGNLGVPLIASGELEISGQGIGTKQWGATTTENIEVGSVRTVTVPPMSRVKASLMATRVPYDIPFSYTQRDILKNGTTKVTERNDGVFTGHNGYDYKYDVIPLPLE